MIRRLLLASALSMLTSGWADAAIAQVGNAAYGSSASAAGTSFSGLSATVGDEQLVVILVKGGTGATITKPASATSIGSCNNTTNEHMEAFLQTTSLSATPAYTFDTSRAFAAVALELSGAGATDVFSLKCDAAGFNSNTPYSGTAVTPTVGNDRLFAVFSEGSIGDTNTLSAAPGGYTEVPTAGGTGTTSTPLLRAYYLDNPALSSQAPSITWSHGNATLEAAYIAIQPAASTNGAAGNGASATAVGTGRVVGGAIGNGR